MRILTIFTGGTIGSRVSNGVIANSEDTNYLLLDLYRKVCGDDVDFLTAEPYRILSENLQAEHLLALKNAVNELTSENAVDGVIITHGTDTLQYTAAMLQYVFGHLQLPILLVSSAYVLTDSRANGLQNFAAAVAFIKEKRGNGVFAAYANELGEVLFHRGSRMQHVISYQANMYSILDGWYGKHVFEETADGSLQLSYLENAEYREGNDAESLFENTGMDLNQVKLSHSSNRILCLHSYPGMEYPALTTNAKAVLIESYHSGTLCIDEALRAFARNARDCKVPIYLIGLVEGEAEYETVQMYRQMGIVPLQNRAAIAQYMKLWLALDNGLDVEKIMTSVIAGDKV